MSVNDSMEDADFGPTRKRTRAVRDAQLDEPRNIPATIKSCNECRQQKLKCDVVKEPFEACSRCRRLNITCRVDSDFKRVAKRNKHAQMQQEIHELKQQLAKTSAQLQAAVSGVQPIAGQTVSVCPSPMNEPFNGQNLGDISLTGERLGFLFEQFFTYYHPLCPLLDPSQNCDYYFNLSPVLAWTVVLIAARRYSQDPSLLTKVSTPYKKLLWATVSEMPQRYHVVKALALLCTWPIPLVMDMSKRNRTERLGGGLGLSEMDPTFMLSGIMMQISLQTGLHRPLHAQDFIKQTRDVSQAEIDNRKLTWAVCNIVAQEVATGSGQPSSTIYEWNLGPGLCQSWEPISAEVIHRLKIEKFCDKIAKSLYCNSSDLLGLVSEREQNTVLHMLKIDLQEVESLAPSLSPINKLSLHAAKLHFTTFAFFISRHSPNYFAALSQTYEAATSFIQAVLDHDLHSNSLFHYSPNHILKTLVSASCVLLKVLNSSLAAHFDFTQGKALFNTAILAMRTISLRNNDFSDRVAEALARMWRAAGAGIPTEGLTNSGYDPLDLKIRSRMNMSHVYDCIWGWRRSIAQNSGPPKDPNVSAAISSIPFLPEKNTAIPYPQTEFFPDQSILTSTLDDFDLFNTLDWTFDDNIFFSGNEQASSTNP